MKAQTVVTGLAWMGIGVRSVKSALKDLLRMQSVRFYCAPILLLAVLTKYLNSLKNA